MDSSESECESGPEVECSDLDSESSIERAAHIQARLLLAWLHSSATLYKSLSLNVVREVASYLWYYPKVLYIDNRNWLCSFDPRAGEGALEVSFDKETVLVGAVTAGEDRYFVSVTSDGMKFPTLLVNNSDEIELPELVRREYCVYYDSPSDRVCVFGGNWSDEDVTFNDDNPFSATCTQLVIGSDKWTDLPEMHRPRGFVPPCLHLGVVYLFGAVDQSVETFAPRTNAFSLVPNATLPEKPFYFTTSIESEIVIVSEHEVIAWDTAKAATRVVATHTLELMGAECVAAAYEGWVYWADLEGDAGIFTKASLDSGEVLQKRGSRDWSAPLRRPRNR